MASSGEGSVLHSGGVYRAGWPFKEVPGVVEKRLESRGWVSTARGLHFLHSGYSGICSGSRGLHTRLSSDLR